MFGNDWGAIALSKNAVFEGRPQHLRLNKHAIRERVAHKDLTVSYISTDQIMDDTFTRRLPRPLFL
jgi:hypothetical protein